MPAVEQKPFLTFQHIADLFKVSRASVYNWHHKRPLPVDPITKRIVLHDDDPEGVEHISDVLPRVLADIARRAAKTALVEGACRRVLPEKVVQRTFDRFEGLKGA